MRFVAITFALVLSACQGATVISPDGSQKYGYCDSANWIKCATGLCPNGYTVVGEPPSTIGDGIIKCR